MIWLKYDKGGFKEGKSKPKIPTGLMFFFSIRNMSSDLYKYNGLDLIICERTGKGNFFIIFEQL